MKIFLDTANVDHIKEANRLGILDGVTTNPTLIVREGKDFKETIKAICDEVDGPVNAETTAMDAEGIVKEGEELASWAPNVTVKVPMCREGLKAVHALSQKGIKTNVTLIFHANQALLAAKAGAAFVSPFVGRLDDVSAYGMEMVAQIAQIYEIHAFDTEVIVASVRHPLHVIEAAEAGADIATVPFKVLDQMISHPLTDIGIEKFLEDWKKVQEKA